MKNLTIFFLFALLTSSVQSQSLTEKEITGTWQVISVVEPGNNAKQANDFLAAYIDIYPDHKFQLRMKTKSENSNKYYNSSPWTFSQGSQTIELNDGKSPIKVSKNNDKMYFEFLDSGMKVEVVMPM